MKIIQVVTQLDVGGVPWVALLISEELRKRGYDIEIWFLYVKNPAYTDYPGIKVLCDRKPSKLQYFKITLQLWRQLQTCQPDVLITHSHYANILGQFAARLWRIPQRIAVQHNPLFTYPKIAQWADFCLGYLGFYTANVGVSQSVLDSAAKYPNRYKKYLKKIYNGISYPTDKILSKKHRLDWHLPENFPLVLNVGRLAEQKNQMILIEAFQYLSEAHLVLAGAGELRNDLEKKVAELKLEERVHFLGEVTPAEVWSLLEIADIFAFPSLYEGMGIAVAEAMDAGLPIVASNIPVMQEIVGNAGLLVSPDQAKKIAKALQKVLDSPNLAQQMSQLSQERSRRFSLQEMINAYEALFK